MATQKKRQERNKFDTALNQVFGECALLSLESLKIACQKAGECATKERLEWHLTHHKRLLKKECQDWVNSKFGAQMDNKFFRVEKTPEKKKSIRQPQRSRFGFVVTGNFLVTALK